MRAYFEHMVFYMLCVHAHVLTQEDCLPTLSSARQSPSLWFLLEARMLQLPAALQPPVTRLIFGLGNVGVNNLPKVVISHPSERLVARYQKHKQHYPAAPPH